MPSQGPCNTIDTACASALVALNACCNAVRNGDCGASPTSNDQSRSAGLACAVSLKLVPHGTIGAASAGMLSVDGRCKTLDNSANGYMRSEAVGAIVMRYHNGARRAPPPPSPSSPLTRPARLPPPRRLDRCGTGAPGACCGVNQVPSGRALRIAHRAQRLGAAPAAHADA